MHHTRSAAACVLASGISPFRTLFDQLPQRQAEHVQKFILVQLPFAEAQPACQEHLDDLGRIRAGGVKRAERDELACDRARFLAQLPQRGLVRVLADVVELPGGDLRQDFAHGIAELPLEQHVAVFQQRQDAHRAVVDGVFPCGGFAVRQADGILVDMQHVAVKDRLGRELCFL